MDFAISISVVFQPYKSFEPPSSTPERDRHMPLGTFLDKIHCRTTLFEGFWLQCVFSAVLSPKCNVFFAVSINVIFQTYKSFELPTSTPGEDEHMLSRTFLDKIQCQINFI